MEDQTGSGAMAPWLAFHMPHAKLTELEGFASRLTTLLSHFKME